MSDAHQPDEASEACPEAVESEPPVEAEASAGRDAGAARARQDTTAGGAAPDEAAADRDGADSADSSEAQPDDATIEATGEDDELSALAAQRDAHLADLQRVSAEFANFRRQTARRHADTLEQAASRLVSALLPVLDACEAAASQGVEGIEAVHSQLLGVLSNEGLSVLGAAGEPFDPGCHEAVAAEASDGAGSDDPVVTEVLRTGYAWKGRVLRAAMVRVRR